MLHKGYRQVVAGGVQRLRQVGPVHRGTKGHNSAKLPRENEAVGIQTVEQQRQYAPIGMRHNEVVEHMNVLGGRRRGPSGTEVGIDVHGRRHRASVLKVGVRIQVHHLPGRVAGSPLKRRSGGQEVPAVGGSAEAVQKVDDAVARGPGLPGPGEVCGRNRHHLVLHRPRPRRKHGGLAAGLPGGRDRERNAQGENESNDQGNGGRGVGASAR